MTDLKEQQLDSRALVNSAQNGDREAFEKLVLKNGDRIRALVASRLNAHLVLGVDADDVYQETLLRAFQSIKKFAWQGEDSLLRWMGGIAENVILELARRRARERTTSFEAHLPAQVVTASRATRRAERFERLEDSLEKLSPEHREVILLTRIQGLTFEAVAQKMGRSPDAVKQLFYRALKQLKSTFGDTESLHLPERGLKREEGEAHGG